ncbi:hypothetical protein HOY80DRAFT_1058593 [Tuber brumale]|nr:hypothetical protein HOY80DRAFT_1058593 [Tuber brumale]
MVSGFNPVPTDLLDIGFFGESLQKEFLVGLGIVEEVDLVVVMWRGSDVWADDILLLSGSHEEVGKLAK